MVKKIPIHPVSAHMLGIRAAMADRNEPRLNRAIFAMYDYRIRHIAANLPTGNLHLGADLRRQWSQALARAERSLILGMVAHSWDLAGMEVQALGARASRARPRTGVRPGRSSVVIARHSADKFFGLKSKSDPSDPSDPRHRAIELGGDTNQDFLQAGDFGQIDRWVATTAEHASTTLADRLEAIFRAANTPDSKGRGLTPRDMAQRFLDQGLVEGRHRANMLAITGAQWSYGEGAVERYSASGVPAIMWHTSESDQPCEACRAMDGVMIETGDTFFDAGEIWKLPSGKVMRMGASKNSSWDVRHQPLHPFCKCGTLPVVDERQLDVSLADVARRKARWGGL